MKTSLQRYDQIARPYKRWQKSLIRKWSLESSFFEHLGNVEGKDVLDLACGGGHYTRRLKLLGARGVVGVDISSPMIELALEEEKRDPLGIFYRIGDVSTLGWAGDYDIVTAAYLLHYAQTKDQLAGMCRTIYANLRSGGRFISLNLDPECPRQPFKRYDCTIEAPEILTDGCVVKINAYLDDRKVCSFENYHWSKETYEQSLKNAGFSDLRWHRVGVSAQGIQHFGKTFWDAYLKQPGVCLIECFKS